MEQRASVFVLVMVLHLVAAWLLWLPRVRIFAAADRQNLQLLLLAPRAAPTDRAPGRDAPAAAGARASRRNAEKSAAAPAFPQQNDAIAPPIDWDGELQRAARDAALLADAPAHREFGVPRAAAPPAAAPEFAWSQARTHPVEILPDGGLAVHLGERCVIVFNPFPFPFCWPGKIPANGRLFEHLSAPAQAGDWRERP